MDEVPIRCYTCGKCISSVHASVVAQEVRVKLHDVMQAIRHQGNVSSAVSTADTAVNPKRLVEEQGIMRMCCKTRITVHS